MLSRPQQILLKRAQAEAGLEDAEYRECIGTVAGMADCTSSKDRRLTDEHLDGLMSFFEAIYWRKVAAGELHRGCKPNAVFQSKGYWAGKNRRGNTSRDRFSATEMQKQVQALEQELMGLGYGLRYLMAIQVRAGSLVGYFGALKRTVEAKRKALAAQGAS